MLIIIVACFVFLTCAALAILFFSQGGGAGGTMFDVDNDGLNVKGEVPPVVTKGGKKAWEVTFKKGKIHGEGSNADVTMAPSGIFPTESCRVKFKMWFDDAWQWDNDGGHRVGGKLGGFKVGNGKASGGRYSTDAATYRLTFDEGRGAVAYLYPQVKQDMETRDPSWEFLDQHQDLVDVSYIATGVHVFAPNRTPQLHFKSGQWNAVEMYIKLNTPGKKDGVLELVVNGERRRLNTVRYRTDDIRIEHFEVSPFFGGSSEAYAPSQDVKLWYTDWSFSK